MNPSVTALVQCDIRGCEGAGTHRFHAEGGEVVDLCDLHSTIIEALPPHTDLGTGVEP